MEHTGNLLVRVTLFSDRAPPPPAALVSYKMMAHDPRAEPRYGERVPYVVVFGDPNARLSDLVISPETMLQSSTKYILNSIYYITKQIIPALSRVFNLVGVDVKSWYAGKDLPQRNFDVLTFGRNATIPTAANESVATIECECDSDHH